MVEVGSYKVIYPEEVVAEEVKEEGASGARVRWLISKTDGAPNFSMRIIEVEPGGRTPLHSHPWEHEIFILEGSCRAVLGDDERLVERRAAIYVPPNTRHSFMNVGREKLVFICVIPHVQR